MKQEHKQQFKEFCEIFKGLNVAQAVEKAKDLGLAYNKDGELVDIDYKRICATVYEKNGIGHISTSIYVYNTCETDYELVEMEG